MAFTTQPIQSNTVGTQGYLNGIDTLYAFNVVPQVWGEINNLYGKGIGVMQFLQFAGKTRNIKNHSLELLERGSLERGVTLRDIGAGVGIAAGAVGADHTIQVAAGDYDAAGECFLSIDDAVFIPPIYSAGTSLLPAKYQVISRAGGVNNYTFTITPFDSTTQISVNVPSGAVLMITGGNYSPGSDGPSYKSTGLFHRYFKTSIKKRSFFVEGGATSTQRYTDIKRNGQPGYFTQASLEADFLLDSDINDEIFLGQLNNNTLTMPNRSAANTAIYATQGLWSHLDTGGMLQDYAVNYEISDFDLIKEMFRSQGVIDVNCFYGVGSDLNRQIENSGLEFLKEYSGGTDLMRNYNEIGVQFKVIKKNGIRFLIQELVNFDNPVKYGLGDYNWTKAGFLIPDTTVTVREGGYDAAEIQMSNLTLGYKNYNGENRTRISKVIPGVEGHTGNPIAVDSYDDISGQFLSEFMLIVLKRNQMIAVTPENF